MQEGEGAGGAHGEEEEDMARFGCAFDFLDECVVCAPKHEQVNEQQPQATRPM